MIRLDVPKVVWGESLRWDDRRQRLYYVDCAAQTLHWLDGGEPPAQTMALGQLPTGVALTDGDEILVCLDDGIHVVDADAGTTSLLTPYPDGIGMRANDMAADPGGGLVTGTLNLAPGPGSAWRYTAADGWTLLDDDIGNANGPVFVDDSTFALGDTLAGRVYVYGWPGATSRRVLHDHAAAFEGGAPDGATADASGGAWCCVVRVGKVVRLTTAGVQHVLDVPAANPSDVCFGGPAMDRLFVTSIALGDDGNDDAGRLLAFDGLGVVGRPERRFALSR